MEVQFFGNVGKDAEVKAMQDGREQVSFTAAENRKVNGQETTNWVSVWYGNTKLAAYLKKGTRVFVRGELTTNIYQTKEGGNKVGLTVYANKIELLGAQSDNKPKAEGTQNGNTAYVSKPQYAGDIAPNGGDAPEGDVPF